MKLFVVFVLVASVGIVLSAPQGNPSDVTLVRSINNLQADFGGYQWSYELSDGTLREEAGGQKPIGDESPIVVVGFYSWVAPDGQTHWVQYTADENGYHPIVGVGGGPGGAGPGGPGGAGVSGIDPNALKSLIG